MPDDMLPRVSLTMATAMSFGARTVRVVLACALVLMNGTGVAADAQAADGKSSAPPVTVTMKPGQTPDEIARLVSGLRDRGLTVVVEVVGGSDGAAVPAKAAASRPQPASGLYALFSEFPAAFMEGLAASADRVSALPGLVGDITSKLQAVDWTYALETAAKIVLFIAGLLLAAYVTYRSVGALLAGGMKKSTPTFLGLLEVALIRLAADLTALMVLFVVGARAAAYIFAGEPSAAWLAEGIVRGLALFGAYFMFARLLLAPLPSGGRLLPIANAERNGRLFLIYAAVGVCILWTTAIASQIARNPEAVDGWLFLCGTLVNIYKIWWFWTVRHDISGLILPPARRATGSTAFERLLAVAVPAIGITLPIVLWVIITVASVSTQRDLLAGATAVTQLLFFAVPIAVAGAAHVASALVAARNETGAYADAARAVAGTMSGGAMAIAGLLVLMGVWDFALGSRSEQVHDALRSMAVIGSVLLVGWVILRYLQAFFDTHAPKATRKLPGEEDEALDVPQSRIATALPLIRNFALGAVVAVIALIALSRLGVDIAPLLAGAGIIGLAISFGSQALVRDIVSGVFFMADDAFRVGEYIDSGRLKGTVERISLRALQLRHQNGQIHTIPYGQLQSITNFSRDWATMKFTVRLDRSTDIEVVRKVIKKVGQDMLADPEVGADFLLPVKMQGVTDIAENALVVRIKFTAKPSRPTYVQRLALRRIYTALTAAGVQFATNAVTVLGQSGDGRSAAAAVPKGMTSSDGGPALTTS